MRRFHEDAYTRHIDDLKAFVANRIETKFGNEWLKKKSINKRKAQSRKSREKKGKQLNFNKETPEMQEAIRQGRIKEWNNYKTFEAARIIPAEEAHELMKQGYIPIDMQWIDVDKNAHKAAKITDKDTTEQILVKNDQEKAHVVASLKEQYAVVRFQASL